MITYKGKPNYWEKNLSKYHFVHISDLDFLTVGHVTLFSRRGFVNVSVY